MSPKIERLGARRNDAALASGDLGVLLINRTSMLSFQRGTHRTQRKRRWRKSPVDTIDPAAVALGRKDRLMEELAHAPLTPEQRAEIAKKVTKK